MRQDQAALRHAPAIVALAMMALALFMTTPTGGDFWWYDAPRHAMNGVFLRDFLFEGGLLHPLRFASEYYRQYPAINIGFYPPFLYIASAPFMAVFGVSHAVSQAVVVLHALLAGAMIYLICQRMMDRLSALLVALTILALPEMALWARQVQLDVPALALLLCARPPPGPPSPARIFRYRSAPSGGRTRECSRGGLPRRQSSGRGSVRRPGRRRVPYLRARLPSSRLRPRASAWQAGSSR